MIRFAHKKKIRLDNRASSLADKQKTMGNCSVGMYLPVSTSMYVTHTLNDTTKRGYQWQKFGIMHKRVGSVKLVHFYGYHLSYRPV